MKKLLFISILFFISYISAAQNVVTYKVPPKDIEDLLLAKQIPLVNTDSKAEWMLIMERNSYPAVEELGQPEIRIAGLRLNPNNFSLTRQNFINDLKLKNIKTNKELPIVGLPKNLQASNVNWSPLENKIAFLNNTPTKVELYVIDVSAHTSTKVNKQGVNNTFGNAYIWVDEQTIIYKAIVAQVSSTPKKKITPSGPTIQESLGKTAPSATFQDLIKSPYDEELFQFFGNAQLVETRNGVERKIGSPSIYQTISLSPDKKYLLTKILHAPFSYLVPARGFPSIVSIIDLSGKLKKVIADLPSSEGTPSGFDNTQNVPRDFEWRADQPASLVWCKPLDSGLIKKQVDFHDAVYELQAPFTGEPKELFKTVMRYNGTRWGTDQLAIVEEGSQAKQLSRISRYNPSTGNLEKLYDLNHTDGYNNPGDPVTKKNQWGREVILTIDNGKKLLMNNPVGASPKGDLPFLAKYDLVSKQNDIIWRCPEGYYEYIVDVVDPDKLVMVTRKESATEVPNYYIKNITGSISEKAITHFTNPYPQLEGVSKQKIFYKRADGVDLSGVLYLPKGYNKDKDGSLPILMWAYPREFNSAADAAQVRGSQYRFPLINWASPVFYVTQGYAILDNAEMPVVSKEGRKPNDNFIEQLQLNAEAAIHKLSEMGVGDSTRVAVGGHSYGAFMTVNLLAHTHLFKAGIARSGAYNRTFTPFGFQNEERTYWQAPQLYYEMSPFSYADKIKTPLLLIHGEADDNTGTFPINSERLFNAIKGNGGTVRFVFLPYEAHAYRGKENLLHMLWEQNQWLEKYVSKK